MGATATIASSFDRAWDVGRTVDGGAGCRAQPASDREAWSALKWLWSKSELPSVKACRRSAIPGGEGVTLTIDTDGRAAVRGVRRCGSVWACPLCSATVWGERLRDLHHLLDAADAEGLRVALITLTMRHRRTDKLAQLWDGMGPALRDALGAGSRKVRELREELGVWGVVRRTEATYGASGWHLHPHLLVFAEDGDQQDFERLADAMFDTWRAGLKKQTKEGEQAPPLPTRSHGVNVKLLDLSHAKREAARYVTSAGSFHAAAELADQRGKSARYGNRTTWELLDAARTGDREAAKLWAEWELASKGRCAWDNRSPRLRQLAAEHVEQLPDEPPAPDAICHLHESEWETVCRDHDPVELITAAEDAYREAMRATDRREEGLEAATFATAMLLDRWGIGARASPPPLVLAGFPQPASRQRASDSGPTALAA